MAHGVVATCGHKQVAKLHGSQEIGTYLIYLFLFVIGVPASVSKILTETPLLLAFTGIMVVVNMLFCFVGGKLLQGFDLEDIILASNANIGGPDHCGGHGHLPRAGRALVGPADAGRRPSAMSSATTPVLLSALSSVHNKRQHCCQLQ